MIEQPQIAELSPQRVTAFIHVRCTCEEIQLVMSRGVRELLDGVRAQGIHPIAPLYTHHLLRPTDRFDVEIGVPIDRPVRAAGRLCAGIWPSMRVARTVHRGRYEELGRSWGEFSKWIASQGLRRTDDLWECYVSGPECGSDAQMWRTELIQPLRQ